MIPPPSIPLRQRRKLLSAFEEFSALHSRYRIPYGIPLPVREAYPNGRLPLSNGRSKTMLPLEQRRPRYDTIVESQPSGQTSSIFSRPLSEYLIGSQSLGSMNKLSATSSSEVDITAAMLPQRPGSAVIAQVTAPSPSTPPLSRAQSYSGLHSRNTLSPSPGTTAMSSYFSNLSATTVANETVNTQGNRLSVGHSNSSSISSKNGIPGSEDNDLNSSTTSISTSDTEKRDVSHDGGTAGKGKGLVPLL
jgi:hypothetical protein